MSMKKDCDTCVHYHDIRNVRIGGDVGVDEISMCPDGEETNDSCCSDDIECEKYLNK